MEAINHAISATLRPTTLISEMCQILKIIKIYKLGPQDFIFPSFDICRIFGTTEDFRAGIRMIPREIRNCNWVV